MNIVPNKSLDMVYEGRSNIKNTVPTTLALSSGKSTKSCPPSPQIKHRRISISDSVDHSPAIFRSSSFSST